MSLLLLLAAIAGLMMGPTAAVLGYSWAEQRRLDRACAQLKHEWQTLGGVVCCKRCHRVPTE